MSFFQVRFGEKPSMFVILGLLTVCIGCSSTSGIRGSEAVSESPSGQTVRSKYVIIDNQKLARGIQIVDLKSEFIGDMLKSDVTIVNKYGKNLSIQYKFTWFDENGMEVEPGSTYWKPIILYGNESKSLQGTAPAPPAVEYKIHIK